MDYHTSFLLLFLAICLAVSLLCVLPLCVLAVWDRVVRVKHNRAGVSLQTMRTSKMAAGAGGAYGLGWCFLGAGAFGEIPPFLAAFLAFSLWSFGTFGSYHLVFRRGTLPFRAADDSGELWVLRNRRVRRMKIGAVLLCLFYLVSAFVISAATQLTCVSMVPEAATTLWTRASNPPVCPPGPPCHVFVTLPQEPSTSLIVNFHTASILPGQASTVWFDFASHNQTLDYQFSTTGWNFESKAAEDSRVVHWVDLEGLPPNSVVYFRAGTDGAGASTSSEYSVKTLPVDESVGIHFVTGGDIGLMPVVEKLSKVIAGRQPEPSFALIGGDIAYANAFPTCYAIWDQWFDLYERTMVTTAGHIIPMIMSIGNHEAGGFGLPRSNVPFYIKYFPHKLGLGSVSPDARSVYHSHRIGSETFIAVLDSGVVDSYVGEQTLWLDNQLSINKNRAVKMALYHAPLYPSRRPFDYDEGVLGRLHWGPLFDQYNLSLGLENHDHAFKRSHLLRNEEITADGTLYIGDGCWGATPRAVEERWYLATSAAINHVWAISINSTAIALDAIGADGLSFDSVTGTLAPARVDWPVAPNQYTPVSSRSHTEVAGRSVEVLEWPLELVDVLKRRQDLGF